MKLENVTVTTLEEFYKERAVIENFAEKISKEEYESIEEGDGYGKSDNE